MKTLVLWTIIAIGELMGCYLVFIGIQKKIKRNATFKLRHLFQNISLSESSGTQLVIEGILGILLGLLFYYVMYGFNIQGVRS